MYLPNKQHVHCPVCEHPNQLWDVQEMSGSYLWLCRKLKLRESDKDIDDCIYLDSLVQLALAVNVMKAASGLRPTSMCLNAGTHSYSTLMLMAHLSFSNSLP